MNKSMLRHLWLFLACIALAAAPWLGGAWEGVGPGVARSLVGVAGLAWIADRWGEWRFPRPAMWIWAFIGWSAITVMPRTNLHASLLSMGDLVTYAVLLTLAADAAEDVQRRSLILGAILLGTAVAAGMGAAHAIAAGTGWREFGPFVTPNIFAAYLITVIPVAILLAVRTLTKDASSEEYRRTPLNISLTLIGIIAMATGFTALLRTGSKGALGALLLATLAVFAAGRVWRYWRAPMAVMACLIFVFASGIGGRTVAGRVETAKTTEAHSSQFRVLTWKGAAHMAAAHPLLGTGIGTFGSAFNRYAIAGWTQAAHNAYLQTAAETGVPGLVLMLAVLGSMGVALWKRARAGSVLAIGALAGLAAAALHNGVDYGWSLWGPSAVLVALVGLGYDPRQTVRAPRWLVTLSGAATAVTLLMGILVANAAVLAGPALDGTSNLSPAQRVDALRSARALDPLDGVLARQQGFALAQTGDQDAAISTLKEATRLAPGDPVAWRMLGEGYVNTGHPAEARAAFERGLTYSPVSYKLLLDAARLEEATSRPDAALAYYRRMVAAAEGPVGRYPATPEIVDPEPLYAYATLAADADRRRQPAEAAAFRRSLIALADRYEQNREQYETLWKAIGKDDPGVLESVQALRRQAEAALSR